MPGFRFPAALSLLTERQVPADSPLYKGIPQKYFSIYPLDSPNTDSSQSGSFGYPSVLYKALSKDGYPLALRRFDNVRCSHSIAQAASTAWKRVKHPAVVKLHSCYTQGRAVFFVHEYLPGAVSLRDRYITPHADPATANPQQVSPKSAQRAPKERPKNEGEGMEGWRDARRMIYVCVCYVLGGDQRSLLTPENSCAWRCIAVYSCLPSSVRTCAVLTCVFVTSQVSDRIMWSYISQLVAVLRNIHGTSMACRCLTPAHVLRTSGGRLRVSCVGVVDVLEFEARKHLADLQREDVRDLGRLILALGTRAIIPPATDVAGMQKAAAIFQTHYPAELYNFAVACLSKPLSIFDVCGLMGHHVFEELDVVQSVADGYEAQLSREFESGRSLRLLLKLGFVNERPELGIDRQWAETGDRYVHDHVGYKRALTSTRAKRALLIYSRSPCSPPINPRSPLIHSHSLPRSLLS